MKKYMLLILVALLCTNTIFAQTASINFNIKNAPLFNCKLYDQSGLIAKGESISLVLDEKGHAVYNSKLSSPKMLSFMCYDNKSKANLSYTFFISPGDRLSFDADIHKKEDQVIVSGKGSNNNQSLLGEVNDLLNIEDLYGDTLPDRIKTRILKQEKNLKERLEKYIVLYGPSKEFVELQSANLEYLALRTYYGFKENNKFQIGESYKRNLDKWQTIQDSLLKKYPLDHPQAICAPNYTAFIKMFLLREKERLWDQQDENGSAFYKKWYGDEVIGAIQFKEDKSNALTEKIINAYFKDKTEEYLYAYLLMNAMDESNPKNWLEIYGRYKSKFPDNPYDSLLKPLRAEVKMKREQGLNERMVFADSTATELKSFSDLLALAKNKTVLVDMWGTWCTPCRNEIEANSAEIKRHFKGKDLQYFYVANYDTQNSKSWKELIAYFKLEGTHVLANEEFTKDIMSTVKARGYPTYFLIKKDGSYELSKAGFPMDRSKLIEQLEQALLIK